MTEPGWAAGRRRLTPSAGPRRRRRVATRPAWSSTPASVQASPNPSHAIGQPNNMTAEASRIAAPIGQARRPIST